MIYDKKPPEYGQPSVIVPMPRAGSPSHGMPPCAVIDAGLRIEGDLETDRDVQLDGRIAGDVSCARLTIGKDGAICGDMHPANNSAVAPVITDVLHALLVKRADELMGCPEESIGACELEAIIDAIEAYEAVRWPSGKADGGKG